MIHQIKETDSYEEFLNKIIRYLETTDEENWIVEKVRDKEGKGCLLSHLFDFGGAELCNTFEEIVATTYMFYPVNDGEHSRYQLDKPKDRCIAYIKDIRDKKEKSTYDLMKEEL